MPAHCQASHGASDFNRCCGVWVQNLSVELWEEHTLTVFENRAWRKLRGPKLEEEWAGRIA